MENVFGWVYLFFDYFNNSYQDKSTAPVDVVPSSPKLITAPFDGVVKNIVINNNDKIIVGDLVVLLEDLDLTNEYNLAQQSLQIAEELYEVDNHLFQIKKKKQDWQN